MPIRKKDAAIGAALVTVAGAILGNVITAFGPSVLSYYQKPRFVDTPAYKQLRQDNPNFEAKLKEQLADARAVIKNRDADFKFEGREGNSLIIRLSQRSEIQNVTKDRITTSLKITMQGDSKVMEAEITSGEHRLAFGENTLRDATRTSPSGSSSVEIPYAIDGGKSVSIKTVYRLKKPLEYMEPLIVDKILTGNYDVRIAFDASLKGCLRFTNESFAFESPIPINNEPNGTLRMTLAGPLLPGQGLGVSWACKQ